VADVWRLLIDAPAGGAWNMAEDESILEHAAQGLAPPTLRLFAWEPACLSLGYAQPHSDVDLRRLGERGWDLVRRPTGGRAILHADELTYSVIAAQSEEHVAGSLLESYNRLAEALLHAVRQLGVDARMTGDAEADRNSVNPVCFEAPSAYEIIVEGKKLIGSAQARRKQGVLQHGSLPLHGDLRRITEALAYPDEAARSDAAWRLLMRATTMEAALNRIVSWNEAAQAFVGAFETVLGLRLESGSLSDQESSRARALVAQKYGQPEWTERT
jgi:lipoyl(octanoyl) transferase